MKNQGPPLESMLRRLAETPEDFLAPAHTAALVADLVTMLGGHPDPADLRDILGRDDTPQSAVIRILVYLLASDWFQTHPPSARSLPALIMELSHQAASENPALLYVSDADRREELVRLVLARLELRPEGESAAEAQDRLTTLSSTERARVIAAARTAEQRARAIREALARKAAEESADKWSRE